MKQGTLIIGIESAEEKKRRVLSIFRGDKADPTPRFSFASVEELARTLNPERWSLLTALVGAPKALAPAELAKKVGRDEKAVNNDAQVLLHGKLIQQDDGGKLFFPYPRLRVEFELPAPTA